MQLSGTTLLAALLITQFSVYPVGQNKAKKCPTAVADHIPTVSFCELVHNPALYDRKVVRVKATFLIGAETRIIYDARCKEEAWVEFDYFFDECTDRKIRDSLWKLKAPDGEGMFKDGIRESEITAVGLFVHGQEGFGHMNAYKFEFTIKWIDRIKGASKK
jgi:hypothetical protein